MKVEIYGSAESHTVRGATVNFNADSAAPVTEFVAEVNPNGFDGRTGVDINKNGTTQSVAFGKTCYGGSANVTTGTLTEEYGGGAYDPQNVPAEVKSEVESKLTLETATPGGIVSFDCELGEYPLNSLSIHLAPIQDLHGYDSPWPAGGGKNLIDLDITKTADASLNHNSPAIQVQPGDYYVYCCNESSSNFNSFVQISTDGSTFSNIDTDTTVQTAYADQTMAFGKRKSKVTVVTALYIRIRLNAGSSLSGAFKGVITTDSTGYSSFPNACTISNAAFQAVWSPYENICPISGWSEAKVTRTGVNVWDEEWENGTWTANGQKAAASDAVRSKNFIPVKPETSYYVTFPTATYTRGLIFRELDGDGAVVQSWTVLTPRIFTASASTRFIVFCSYRSDGVTTYNHDVSINYPSTDHDYHAYAGNRYTITLGQTVYGGTLDVTAGTLTVDMAMVDLGSFDYYWQQHNVRFVSTAEFPGAKYPPNDLIPFVGVCSAMPVIATSVTVGTGVSLGIAFSPNDSLARIRYPGITDATAFKAAMSGVQLVYELATPLTYTLTTEQLTTLLGQNNVWCDAGEIGELKYYDGDITDTDIQTENGVLVTGDKLFYALSSPRTSSFTQTAVNTVQGENTMSANTGNIAVTYTSNWHDITPWIAWQGLTFSRNDVDGPNAGRDMAGYMHRGRVASKEKMNVNTIPLTRAQSAKLQTLLFPETILVRVTPYPRTNAAQIFNMYCNNVKTSYVIHRNSGEDLQTVSFPLIEN